MDRSAMSDLRAVRQQMGQLEAEHRMRVRAALREVRVVLAEHPGMEELDIVRTAVAMVEAELEVHP